MKRLHLKSLFLFCVGVTVLMMLMPLSQAVEMRQIRSEYIQPLEPVAKVDSEKAALGEQLFREQRLSGDGSVSCASCHQLEHGGADVLSHSFGVGGAQGMVNTPTVFNAAYNSHQFWDGRALTLEEQVDFPLTNELEMDSSWEQVTSFLLSSDLYRLQFERIYKDGVNITNVRDAIASYERTLVTLDAPFDRYLRGDLQAISVQAEKGYELFKSYGCVACHQGRNVGGNMFQKFGVMRDYFASHGVLETSDLGRFNVTGNEMDRHVFKVPSLRLAVLTPPYFHDGRVASLDEAIRVMGRFQLGRDIPDEDIHLIVTFLHSLVGEYRRSRLQ